MQQENITGGPEEGASVTNTSQPDPLVEGTSNGSYCTGEAPLPPHAFFGKIEFEGKPVAAGVEVRASGAGVRTGIEGNPIVSDQGGYGNEGIFDEKLIVQGDITPGTPIEFSVGGMPGLVYEVGSAGDWQSNYPFTPGGITELDIRIVTAGKSATGIESILSVATWESSEDYPAIYEDSVVWSDYRSGYTEIYLYNLTSGEEYRLSHSEMGAERPDIWGDRIVWQDWRNYNYDIYMYDLALDEEIQVTNDTYDQVNPKIWGDWIVWEDWRDYENYIYLYDISNGSEEKITKEDSYESNPSIFGNRIVWEDWRNQNYDVYMYDHDTGIETRVTNDSSDQMNPEIWDDYIVWEDYRDGLYQIYWFDVGTGNETRLTGGNGFYGNPVICQDVVAYVNQTGYYDISAYNLIDGTEISITQSTDSAEMNPDIWGDRIVWQDGRNENYDIYLYTIDVAEAPLGAEFSANITKGDSPLIVHFYDESSGPVAGYRWDFGDGNFSNEKDPVHTYQTQGTFSPVLIVHDPYQRDAIRKMFYISVGSAPLPDFSVNVTCGPAPLEVRFNDSSSGLPDTWYWDFGDGYTSYEQNPVHKYSQPGVYDINLTAGNSVGNSSISRPGYITVMDGTYNATFLCCDGISVVYVGDAQEVSINSSLFSYCAIDPSSNSTVVELIPPPDTGLSLIILESMDGTGFSCLDNGTISGNLTGVMYQSEDAQPLNFTDETGTNCRFNYSVHLQEYPVGGEINVVSWEGCSPDDYPVFNETAMRYNYESITGFAYSARFNEKNCTAGGPASVIFAVNSSWVSTHGWGDHGAVEIDSNPQSAKVLIDGIFKGYTPITVNSLAPGDHTATVSMAGFEPEISNFTIRDERDSIHILRIGEDEWGEVLNTRFIYHDPELNLDYFQAESPQGLSTFGVAALSKSGNFLQMLYLTISRMVGGSGGGGGSGGSVGGPSIETPTPATTIVGKEEPSVPIEPEKTGAEPKIPAEQPPEIYPTGTPGDTPAPTQPVPSPGETTMILLKNLSVVFVVILVTTIFYFRWKRNKGGN
ncbi:MAG TPA: PKD domain-containing protein [Methanoregulaceae archaeon]|nr:PKD domain-containing protein [Methanoregulaceae archaeon]